MPGTDPSLRLLEAPVELDDHDSWPEEDRQEPREPIARTWQPQDLTAVLDGTYQPPQPTVGRRDDGPGLFYPGRVHSVASESEGGKTWLALLACLQEMNDGHHVVYVDFEDDASGVVGRLLALGANRDDVQALFHYVRPEARPTAADLLDLGGVLQLQPTLAIIDGVTEAMSLFGLELKDNTDVASFGRQLLRPLTACGAAVVTLDHVVKSAEGRGRYSLGGVHKLNGINGAMYILENRTPFGIGVTGRTTVRIAKDRPAQLRKNAVPSAGLHWFADLVIVSRDEMFAEAHLYAPVPRSEEDRQVPEETDRTRMLQARILEALGAAPGPLSVRGVQDRVSGKVADVRRALALLVDDGRVLTAPGPRNATLHRVPGVDS